LGCGTLLTEWNKSGSLVQRLEEPERWGCLRQARLDTSAMVHYVNVERIARGKMGAEGHDWAAVVTRTSF